MPANKPLAPQDWQFKREDLSEPAAAQPPASRKPRWQFWTQISRMGLREPATRLATHGLSILLVLGMVWALRTFYLRTLPEESAVLKSVFAADLPTPTPTSPAPELPFYPLPEPQAISSISRAVSLYTTIPTRPRVGVITYTVKTGDSVFGIAGQFALNPETILWSNYSVLADNPHLLQPGQVLTILPVNGTYHKWSAGEDLQKVAAYYQVSPAAIIEWPGNHFDLFEFDLENPPITPGTMLIIPGGRREFVSYDPPRIPRDDPAVARTYGPGHCGTIMDGPIGVGSFLWPTVDHTLIGYDYSPGTNHFGIDLGGEMGNPIWAVDNGVVVYAGWSNNGYGNLVVIDHGNEWQSLYAHLNDIYVSCGQSVYQGNSIGALGTTGASSGPHLHFELIYGTAKVNPWDFLP